MKKILMLSSGFLMVMMVLCTLPAQASHTKTNKGNNASMINQPFTDPHKAISVYQGVSQFAIKLRSNPTTGYSWFLAHYNTHLMVPMSHHYYAPKTKLVGASGYEVWIFKLLPTAFKVPQLVVFQMKYARPFALAQAHTTSFAVATVVKSSLNMN